MTRLLLIRHGYACDTAGSGQEVEQRLQEQTYDLLISDIDMPGNQNLQLVASLPQIQAGLPVILITGAPSVHSAAQSVGLFVAAYLIKPVESAVLLEHVRKAIERHQCFRTIVQSRQRHLQASADLERLEWALRTPSGGTADASMQTFLDLTMRNAAQSLADLRLLLETLRVPPAAEAGQPALSECRPAILMQALWETVAVLEKTKTSFKSKELGELRKKLEGILGEAKRPPSGG